MPFSNLITPQKRSNQRGAFSKNFFLSSKRTFWVMMTESSTLWLKFWLDLESKVWTKDSTLKSGPKNYLCVLCQKAGKRPLSPSGENYNWQTDPIDLLYCKKRQKTYQYYYLFEIMSFSCDYFVFVIWLYTE